MQTNETYAQVARLHAESINQGFLPTLGVRFLALMYRAIDECESAVLLIEEDNGCVIGFVSGASNMGAIYRKMLQHFLQLVMALLPSVVRPARVWRILEIIRYSRNSEGDGTLPAHELLSIAVAESHRGQGVAESLYQRLVEYFKAENVTEFRIVVGQSLTPAHRFYRRMGALSVTEAEVHGGQRSTIYVHSVK
ncbi:MAG: GNAT family N-acetyltransferase [Pseudohongiellaceae bacterium]